jgi:hypothetical protein
MKTRPCHHDLLPPYGANWLRFVGIEIAFSMTGNGGKEVNGVPRYTVVIVNDKHRQRLFVRWNGMLSYLQRNVYLSKLNVIHLKRSRVLSLRILCKSCWHCYEVFSQSRSSIDRVYMAKEKKKELKGIVRAIWNRFYVGENVGTSAISFSIEWLQTI